MDFERMLSYCSALDAHNDRAWFHENHRWYEDARGDFLALLDTLRYAIADRAPALSGDIMLMKPRDWMYRVARDMRFYKDRPPYDPAFRAYICADRKSMLPIGYYLRVFPDDSCFGTGLWYEDTADINRIRDYISAHFGELTDVLAGSGLTLGGDRLKTMPRGYSAQLPAAEYLRFKNWSVIEPIPAAMFESFDSFSDGVRALVTRMEPVRLFLLRAARGELSQKEILQDFYKNGV